MNVNGVKAVVPTEPASCFKKYPEAIAVVASSNWQALKGMEVLNPIFKGGDTLNLSSNKMKKYSNKKSTRLNFLKKRFKRTLKLNMTPYMRMRL